MSKLTTFNLSFFYHDCCTLSGPNDPSWERYKLCGDVLKANVDDVHSTFFFEHISNFSEHKLEGIYFSHTHGYCSVVHKLTITNKRAFNIFKLKGDAYMKRIFDNGVMNHARNEEDSWSRFQKWISAEDFYNENY